MKKRYKSTDVRTGYPEGEIVELDDDELGKLPFNVKMEYVGIAEKVLSDYPLEPVATIRKTRRT